MAKKQSVTASDILTGRVQPISADNEPGIYTPIIEGDEINVDELIKNTSDYNWSIPTEDPILPYRGKYYRGSGSDPFQKTIQGENQPWLKQAVNGLASNTLAIGTKAAGMIGAPIGGVYDAVTNLLPNVAQSRKDEYGTMFPHLFENIITKSAEYLEQDLIKETLMPVYGSQKYYSDKLLSKMGSTKFWADDAADAVSFTIAALFTTKGVGALTKAIGSSKTMLNLVKAGEKGLELTGKGKLIQAMGATVLNTAGEASMEARQGLMDMREDLASDYYNTSYDNLTPEQKTRVNQEAAPYARNIFNSNAGVLLGPNLIQARFFIGPIRDTSTKLKKAIRAGTLNMATLNATRNALKLGGIGLVSEGLWEEGSQQAIQNYEKSKADGTAFLNRGTGYLYEWVNNWADTEGQTSMLLGALIGMGSGSVRGVIDSHAQKAFAKGYADKYQQIVNETFNAADNILPSNIKSLFKTYKRDIEKDGVKNTINTIINPETNKAHIDLDKVLKMYNLSMSKKEVFDNLMMAALNGDEVHEKFYINQALSQLFYSYAANNIFEDVDEAFEVMMQRNPIDKLAEDEDIKALGLDFDAMKGKLSQMKNEWKDLQKRLKDVEDLKNDDIDYVTFSDLVEKTDFYQRMKLRWLEDVDPLIEDKEQIERIRKDAQDAIDIFENKAERKKLYDEYLNRKTLNYNLREKKNNEERKDPNSLESKKYKYLIEEEETIFGSNRENDPFTIAYDIEKIPSDIGFKNQHYLNIAADAIVGLRLGSAIRKVRDHTTGLREAVEVLKRPSEGSVETRSKFDVTEKDIQAVRDVIKNAEERLSNLESLYREHEKDVNDILEQQTAIEVGAEEGELMDNDALNLLKSEIEEEKKLLDIEKRDHNEAIFELNEIETFDDGKGLLTYADGISKAEMDDDIFLQKVADVPIDEARDLENIIKNNENYSNKKRVEDILNRLKERKELYEKTELKERLERKAFKGYIESLDKAISRITDEILVNVTNKYNESRNFNKTNQINRNRKRFAALGITFDDKNNVTYDDEIKKILENIITPKKLKDIIDQAIASEEEGEEYLFHEVFTDKIVEIVKALKDPDKKKAFFDFIKKRYSQNRDEFVNKYYEINKIELKDRAGTKNKDIDSYRLNPRNLIKDLLRVSLGRRREDLAKETATDIYFDKGNDIIQYIENTEKETDTGHDLGIDELKALLSRHYRVEILQDLVELYESEYKLSDILTAEKEMFTESKLAPNNQQLNAIRKIAIWFGRKLPHPKSTSVDANRFVNWLFIKGSAGTGKTRVVIRYFLRVLNIKPNEVQFLSPHKKSADILTGLSVSSRETINTDKLETIDDEVKVVVIDEIAAINNPQLLKLSNKLEEINRTRKNPFRVIVLGDPNQIAAEENTTNVTAEPSINNANMLGIEYLSIIDPLTIKMRNDYQEMNEFQDIFEGNRGNVDKVPVYANSKVGEPGEGVHAGSEEQMIAMLQKNNNNGRSKVVVVATDNERKKLETDTRLASVRDKIFTFTEIAGTEEDEVYVILDRDMFKDNIQFNKAFYTAISRATKYVFVVDKNNIFESRQKNLTKTENVIDELKDNYDYRLKFEADVLADVIPSGRSIVKEKEREEEEDIDNDGDTDINNNYTPDDSDGTGNDEEDAEENVPSIDVETPKGKIKHKLKYSTHISSKRLELPEGSLSGKLITGGMVIYVKSEDTTGENDYTIHVLGQLYNINNEPINDRYTHLGIVSNEELDDKTLGIGDIIRAKADSEYYAKVSIDPTTKDVTLKITNPELIVATGTLTGASPLKYKYSPTKEPELYGRGFIGKVYKLINQKLFNRRPEPVDYQIRIFNDKELSEGGEYYELADKKLKRGVPYLIIKRVRKDNTKQKLQFVRFDPVPLNAANEHVIELTKFYNAIIKLEGLINGKAKYGTNEFNSMISFFKDNYKIENDTVVFDKYNAKWSIYKNNKYVVLLEEREFKQVQKNITDVIVGIYGKGSRRVAVADEAEMIKRYDLNEKREDKDGNYIYEFHKEKNFGYVFKKSLTNLKNEGEYETEEVLKAGKGKAQNAFNIIAQANRSIDGDNLRIISYTKTSRFTGKEISGRYISTGKSLLATEDSNEAYYTHLRQILKANDYPGVSMEVDGKHILEINPFVRDSNIVQIEKDIVNNGYLKQTELDELRDELTNKPITSDMLGRIVSFDKNGKHASLRTPLPRLHINKIGADSKAIQDNIDELEGLLQTHIKNIIPTSITVSVDRPVKEKKEEEREKATVEKRTYGYTEKELKQREKRDRLFEKKYRTRDIGEGKKMDLTRKESELGKPLTRAYVNKLIKKYIPNLKTDEVDFLAKDVMHRVYKGWGNYKNGIICLTEIRKEGEDEGTVYELIVRHEVFHKVFTEYLTPEEQQKAKELAQKEFVDYEDYIDDEELLAVKWEQWHQGVLQKISDFFKHLFEKILRLFNIYRNNFDTIDELYSRINAGMYTKQLNKGDNTSKKMKEIVNKFGNIRQYLDCLDHMIVLYRDFRIDGVNGIYYTHEELDDAVFKELVREAKRLKRLYEKTKKPAHYIMMRSVELARDNYGELKQDLFPGFNIYKNGQYVPKITDDWKDQLRELRNTTTNKTQWAENSKVNHESDVTDEMKEFLSYVTIDEEDGAEFLSWRFVYQRMIGLFEGLNFEQGNELEQISENIGFKDQTDNEKAIIEYLTKLNSVFTSTTTEKNKKINPNYKYIDQNTFIYSNKSVSDIKHKDDPRITDGTVSKIERNEGEHTKNFAKRILNATKLSKEDLFEYNKRQHYNEIWNTLVTHFNSHRQRDPKLGEKKISFGAHKITHINARGNAITLAVRDRIMYLVGNKFSTIEDIKNFNKKIVPRWEKEAGSNDLAFVRKFLAYTGMAQYASSLNTRNAETIKKDIIETFKTLQTQPIGKPFEKDDKEVDTTEEEKIQREEQNTGGGIYTVEYFLDKDAHGFLRHMTKAISYMDELSRILSSTDANNNRRYNAVLTSQGHKNLYNIINTPHGSKYTGKRTQILNPVFKSKYFERNIFIKAKTNNITRVIDDDGLKYDDYTGGQWSTEYRNEKREDFNFRSFVLGFVTSIVHSPKDDLRYIQYLYPNERPVATGVEVKVLRREQLLDVIKETILQFKEKDITLNEKYEKYNPDSFIGFDVLKEALGKKTLKGVNKSNIDAIALKVYDILDKRSKELTRRIIQDRTAFDSDMPKQWKKLNPVVDKVLYPDFNVDRMPKNKGGYLAPLESNESFEKSTYKKGIDYNSAWDKGEEKEYMITDDHIQALVSSFYINNYVNGFHAAQLVLGDLSAFESVDMITKRMSIALAPGKSGNINEKHGLSRYSRVAVIYDPVKDNNTVQRFIQGLLKSKDDEQVNKILNLYPEKGFKPGDSQGFILPERLGNINYGFGSKMGNVIKGVYYHIGEDNVARALKYSSIVLSDDLCNRYEALKELRDKMRNNPSGVIEEVVFESAVKVGKPRKLNDWYDLVEKKDTLFDEDSMFLIDNTDYRIQLDPEAELDGEVSYPTQLSYILNLYGTNDVIARDVYRSFSEIIKTNWESLQKYKGGKSTKELLEEFLKLSNQENLKELLSEDIDINFPAITDKLLIHYLSANFDRAVKTKFDGTKLILQTALGAKKKFKTAGVKLEDKYDHELEFKVDKDGRLYAEVIIPEEFLHPDLERRIKLALEKGQEPDDYFFYQSGRANITSKDLLGFRIPSSELHSAVPMKVVGFYDSMKTNVVIAPKLLVILHGSDFDIDSLFTIKRSIVKEYKESKGQPIGYEWDEKLKRYVFNKSEDFLKDIKDPRTRRKVTEAFHLNNILENFIEATSSPENMMRMLSPIHLGDANSESKTDGDLHSEKRRIIDLIGEKEKTYDISDAIDQQEIHNTVFTGINDIGGFMAAFKVFSFLHRSKQGHKITELKKEIKKKDGSLVKGVTIKFNGTPYNQMVDVDSDGKESGYRFDSLANASVDNLKERILPFLNAGRETIRAYTTLVMHGVPFRTINDFVTQPVLRYYTKYGNRDAGLLHKKLESLFTDTDKIKDIDLKDEELEGYLKYSPDKLKELAYKNWDDLKDEEKEFLKYQLAVYYQYNKLNELGKEISKIVKLTNTIRGFPVEMAKMEEILSTAKYVLGVPEDGSITDTGKDTDSTFPYYMDEFLTTNPHIREALVVIENVINSVNADFIIYNKTFRKVGDIVAENTGVKLDRNPAINKKKIRDEFVKFLMTSFVDRKGIRPYQIRNRKDKKTITLNGVHAYNKRFVDFVLHAQKQDAIRVKNTKGTEDEYHGNVFLQSLSIRTDPYNGKEKVIFYGPSSMDSIDYNLYKQSFEELKDYDYIADDKGNYAYIRLDPTDPKKRYGNYTDFQKMFVDYAILNYGMSFGLRNYTKVLPAAIYRDLSDDIVMTMKDIEKLPEDKLKNLMEAFEAQLVINYPEGMISRNVKPSKSGITKYTKSIKDPVTNKYKDEYSGEYDGMYFDRLFSSAVSRPWPKWHVEKYGETYTIYRRMTEDTGLNAFYTRVGKKSHDPVYNLINIEDGTNYSAAEQFERKPIDMKLRLVKGYVSSFGLYENDYIELEEGDIINLSDYSDPGAMYSKKYNVKQKMKNGMYVLEENAKIKDSAYFEKENSYVDAVYNQIIKRLKSKTGKGGLVRVYRGKILIQKDALSKARPYYQNINKEEFNNLGILYEQNSSNGIELLVNKDLLRKFLYGRQLDIFSTGFTVIDKIFENDNWEKLNKSTNIFTEEILDNKRRVHETYDGKDIKELLDDIESRTINKFQKYIISWVRPYLEKSSLVYNGDEALKGGVISKFNMSGYISMDYNKVAYLGYNIKETDRILLHELIHAITSVQIQTNKEFRAEIKSWMDIIKDKHKKLVSRYDRAFIDEEEFVAEFFSNISFHKALNEIHKYGDKLSLKDRLINLIYKLFHKGKPVPRFAESFENWMRENIEMTEYMTIDKDGNYVDKTGKKYDKIESYYSTEENTTHLKDIVNEWSDIYNPLDEDGNQRSVYLDKDNKEYKRISDMYEGWIGIFRKSGKHKTFGERMADRQWGVIDKEKKLTIDNKEYTYTEYKKMEDERALKSIVRGRILHLFNKLQVDLVNNNGRNQNRIKEEIQSVAYKDYTIVDSQGNKEKISITIDPETYRWYLDDIQKIWDVHGINTMNDIKDDEKSFIASEVIIANDILGFAGSADIILENTDGTLSIKDMATGRDFDKDISTRLLKYGDQNRQIVDCPRDRKKMQIMMYAFMLKANPKYKDVKFKDLSVMYVPDKYHATEYDKIRKVDVSDFLHMIELFLKDKKALKEEGIDEDAYQKLKELSPKLFTTSEYTYTFEEDVRGLGSINDYYDEKLSKDDLIASLISNDKSPDEKFTAVMNELQRVVGKAPVDIRLGKNRFEDLKDPKDQALAVRLAMQAVQFMQDPELSMEISKDYDISIVTSLLGNYSDLSIPQVQMFKKIKDQQYHLFTLRTDHLKRTHDIVYRKVLKEINDENPHFQLNERNLNFNNYRKMFSWMYKKEEYNGGTKTRLLVEDDAEYKALTSENKKKYITLLNDQYQSYFEGPNAFVNQISTYVAAPGGIYKPITHMELYNRELEGNDKFTYYRGWFPKTPKEQAELLYDIGEGSYLKGITDKKFWNDLWNRSVSYYYENNYQGRNKAAAVLPLQYLGNRKINDAEMYTLNPEVQFDRFTKSIEYKKFTDPVYALGEAVRGWLTMQKDKDQPIYSESAKLLGKLLTADVLGRTIRPKLVSKPIRVITGKDDDKELRADALLMLARNWTSATLMWLKPFTGGGNGLHASLLMHRDAIKSSIAKTKIFGVEEDSLDYTMSDSLYADKIYFTEYIKNSMLGKFEQDKTWLMLKKLRYLPDNFDYMSSDKYMLSLRNKIIDQSSMYAFHRIPEEYVSIITMIAQLRHMKHPTEVDTKTKKPLSLWDCYEVVDKGGGEFDVEWKKGIKSRGLYKQGTGENTQYIEMKELLPQEIAKIKKTYERMQGGYRKEEASGLEAYVIGKMFIQLKKYYPRLLLNAFGSKRQEMDLGYLKKTAERKGDEDVYVWMQRINEGRFRVLGKMLLSAVMMSNGSPEYKWRNMEPLMKQHMIDMAMTLGMWATLYLAYSKMFGDDKDDDTLKVWYKMYLLDNFIQQYSPEELLKIGVQGMQPVAMTRAVQTVASFGTMVAAGFNYSFGDKEEAFTKEGDFRGWKQFKRAIPVIASYTDLIRRFEKSEDLTKIFQFEQFSKWR